MDLPRQEGLDVEQALMMILRLRRSYLHRTCLPVDGTKAWLGRAGRAWLGWTGFILFFSCQAPNIGLVVLYYYTEVCLSWKGFWLWMGHNILGGWMERVGLEVLAGMLFRWKYS